MISLKFISLFLIGSFNFQVKCFAEIFKDSINPYKNCFFQF